MCEICFIMNVPFNNRCILHVKISLILNVFAFIVINQC